MALTFKLDLAISCELDKYKDRSNHQDDLGDNKSNSQNWNDSEEPADQYENCKYINNIVNHNKVLFCPCIYLYGYSKNMGRCP